MKKKTIIRMQLEWLNADKNYEKGYMKSKKKINIDWSLIWAEFDAWIRCEERKHNCKKCFRGGSTPEWEDQQIQLEKIVNQYLNER